MVIAWDALTEDSCLSIECKRLAPDDLARRYVASGIGRFVQGYDGEQAHVGAMVGYVIRGTPDAVLKRVNAQVKRATAMDSQHTLILTGAIGPLSTVFESNHPRSQPFQTIRLTHLFFDMNGIGPTA